MLWDCFLVEVHFVKSFGRKLKIEILIFFVVQLCLEFTSIQEQFADSRAILVSVDDYVKSSCSKDLGSSFEFTVSVILNWDHITLSKMSEHCLVWSSWNVNHYPSASPFIVSDI